jgi:hypothetical protein
MHGVCPFGSYGNCIEPKKEIFLMNRKRSRKSNLKYLAVACVFFFVSATTLSAALPPVGEAVIPNKFTGCLDKEGDLDHVKLGVEPTKLCGKKEAKVSWNILGPMGLQGLMGPAGADGKNGADGAQGPIGPAGADGKNGADGAQGPAGADGENGADGAQGPMGPAGVDGNDGADGAQGPMGPVGISSWERVSAQSFSNKSKDKSILVSCTGTKKLLGGGASLSLTDGNVVIFASYPSTDNTWTAYANTRQSDTNWAVTAWAICAAVN